MELLTNKKTSVEQVVSVVGNGRCVRSPKLFLLSSKLLTSLTLFPSQILTLLLVDLCFEKLLLLRISVKKERNCVHEQEVLVLVLESEFLIVHDIGKSSGLTHELLKLHSVAFRSFSLLA